MKTLQQAVSDYVVENATTKDALADELGFCRSTFFMKLRGASELSLSEAYRIAKKIGCTIDELYQMTQAA